MRSFCLGGRFDRVARPRVAFPAVLFAALILVALSPPEVGAGNRSECNSNCGGSGQIACSVLDCIPSCDKFLREKAESCGFLCTQSICRSSGCGSTNQRACVPFVDHGWPDVCRPGNYNASGTCRALDSDGFPTVCGDQDERACTLAEHFPSCKPDLVEMVSTAGLFCRALEINGHPTHCGDTGEPPCELSEWVPSCKAIDGFEYQGLCAEADDDGFPAFCGGLNEEPCDLGLQAQLGIASCKPTLEEDFGVNSCRDTCGGHGLPACLGTCDAGLSVQLDDVIDTFAVCGAEPIDHGESDADEAEPGGPRVVFFIHGRGGDLTTGNYDADEPLLNALAFASPNIETVYGVDWNNQTTGSPRRVQIKRLDRVNGVPVWTFVQSYGRTPLYHRDFLITDVAQSIASAIEDLGITTPIAIVTHSFGGVIARQLVYRHYDELRAQGHAIVEVVTIKGPHRGGLIGTPDLSATAPIGGAATGLVLQTDFACLTGRLAGIAGYGGGQDGCQLGRWVQWAQSKAPSGIDDTDYPQIRWIAVAGGGHRFDPAAIDALLNAGLFLDDRFEQLLQDEKDPDHTPFLDSDETAAARSAFGIAVDACHPLVQAFAPGSSETGPTVVFDTATWSGDSALSATCYHAAATTKPTRGARQASNHDLSSDEDERDFVIAALTVPLPEPGIGAGWGVGSVLLAALARWKKD